MKPITADQFAAQLRAGGCSVEIGRKDSTTRLYVTKTVRCGDVTMWVDFKDGRFAKACVPSLGQHRRRWIKFHSMSGVRWFLEVPDDAAAKPAKRTLQRDEDGWGYVSSDGRYEVTPIYRTSFREGTGGSVSRPSDWRLEDRDGEHEPIYRSRLSDIRDILKERP